MVPWERTQLPKGKENQANKAVSWSRLSPSPGSRETAEPAPREDLLRSAQLMQKSPIFSAGLKTEVQAGTKLESGQKVQGASIINA